MRNQKEVSEFLDWSPASGKNELFRKLSDAFRRYSLKVDTTVSTEQLLELKKQVEGLLDQRFDYWMKHSIPHQKECRENVEKLIRDSGVLASLKEWLGGITPEELEKGGSGSIKQFEAVLAKKLPSEKMEQLEIYCQLAVNAGDNEIFYGDCFARVFYAFKAYSNPEDEEEVMMWLKIFKMNC